MQSTFYHLPPLHPLSEPPIQRSVSKIPKAQVEAKKPMSSRLLSLKLSSYLSSPEKRRRAPAFSFSRLRRLPRSPPSGSDSLSNTEPEGGLAAECT